MKSNQIKVGGFYVCDAKCLIREIVEESETGDTYWRSYVLSTGKATGDFLVCSRQRMATWANREASDEEVNKIRSHQADAELPYSSSPPKINDLANTVLSECSDEQLLAEVQRRGLK